LFGKVLLQGLECYKVTQMEAYNITKLTAEQKRDNEQYRNKIYTVACFGQLA